MLKSATADSRAAAAPINAKAQPRTGTSIASSFPITGNQATLRLQRKCDCSGPDCDCGMGDDKKKKEKDSARTGLHRAASSPSAPQQIPPIVGETLHSSGQTLDPETRAFFESHFAYDFRDVRIHTDTRAAQSARAVNALAYTVGSHVAFAPGRFSPRTPGGQQLLAHELTHVVQQRSNSASEASHISSPGEPAEREAALAERAIHFGEAPPSVTSSAPALQAFDPDYHETATMDGLAGTFTPQEIGKIYEANWRRDYSQASPAFADIALTWKRLKDATTPQEEVKLQLELAGEIAGIAKNPGSLSGETYGGYQTWEHMDNPGGAAATEADARWAGTGPGDGITGYIRDSRAYIKQDLAQAVGIARQKTNPPDDDFGRRMADAWAGGTPPPNYDITDAYAGRTRPPQGLGVPKSVPDPTQSSSVVASDVAAIAARNPSATNTATTGFASDPQVADDLGRAAHALEDFFAHSNFVELTQQIGAGKTISSKDLRTGTFGGGDKAHSLADKIRGIVSEILAHRDLAPSLVLPDILLNKFLDAAANLENAATLTTGPTSHTALNKDEPSRPNFAKAHQLAVAADHLVFESIHRAIQASMPETSSQVVYDTYALVDSLVNIPSNSHPLKTLFANP